MKQEFIIRYAANMKANSEANPGAYVVPPDGWDGLSARMVEGIIKGSANISDMAKKTAKQMGAKPSRAGILTLLTS